MRKIIILSLALYLTSTVGYSQSNTPANPTPGNPTSPTPANPTPGNINPTPANPTPARTTTTTTTTPTTQPAGSGQKYANGADKNFHFGISVAPGLYWVSPGTTNNNANGVGLGFAFGVNLEFYFTQNYGFVTGINLASVPGNYTNTQAYKNSGGTLDSTVNTQHQLAMQYIQIPLTFKFRTLPIGFFRYFAIVGLNPGIRTSSSDNITVTGSAGNTSISRSASDVNANSETSIIRLPYVFGAGVEYNIAGTTSLQGYLSYDGGFLNMNSSSSSTITSRGVTLTIGVLF